MTIVCKNVTKDEFQAVSLLEKASAGGVSRAAYTLGIVRYRYIVIGDALYMICFIQLFEGKHRCQAIKVDKAKALRYYNRCIEIADKYIAESSEAVKRLSAK